MAAKALKSETAAAIYVEKKQQHGLQLRKGRQQ